TAASGTGADTHAGFERGILEGNEQNNRLNAKDAPFPVTIHGFGGRDTLLAGSFNDTLDGGEGYDLSEMSGSHIVLTDSVAPGADGDVLISIEGLQLVASERGSLIDASVYTLGPVTIVGSSGNDTLKGGSGNDVIMASSGSDVVSGGAGDDFIFGSAGNDDLAGNDGDDRVFGGSGRDTMDGGQGADVLHGGSGADTVQGGDGDDEIQGGSGCDQLDGVDGEDTLVGGGGRNSLAGGTGTDVLNGNVVDNAFQGTVQRDELIGGTRPQERPAPVEYRPDTAEAAKVQVAHPLDSSPSATESDEIDEAFSGSLLPELLTL
ncbi:MAG: calcium-binding protein, partial [Planctomycetota bacterium]|nr:calcium-binding protein [Planctomycetota bacterium]